MTVDGRPLVSMTVVVTIPKFLELIGRVSSYVSWRCF